MNKEPTTTNAELLHAMKKLLEAIQALVDELSNKIET